MNTQSKPSNINDLEVGFNQEEISVRVIRKWKIIINICYKIKDQLHNRRIRLEPVYMTNSFVKINKLGFSNINESKSYWA